MSSYKRERGQVYEWTFGLSLGLTVLLLEHVKGNTWATYVLNSDNDGHNVGVGHYDMDMSGWRLVE